MICRTITDDAFEIVDPLDESITDEAAELLAAAVLRMIEDDALAGSTSVTGDQQEDRS